MTEHLNADCAACRDALTDLVCDELDASARKAVLVHTQQCPDCAAELVKLRAVLQAADAIPLEAPSPRVHAAVMLAAREANVRRAALAQIALTPQRSSEGALEIVRAWLTRLGSWAMSPQVAMASVLLLMLGVGLVALPLGQDREQIALRAAEEADERPEAASGTSLPAASSAPGDSEADKAAETGDALDGPTERKDNYEDSVLAGKPAAKRRDAAQMAEKKLAARDKGALDDETLNFAEPSAPSGLGAATGESQRAGAGGGSFRSKQAFPAVEEQESARGKSGNAADFAAAPPPKPASVAALPIQQSADALPEGARSELTKEERAPEAQLLTQGLDAARRGDYAGAIAVLKPLADKGSPSVRREASLWLARSYRGSNDCSAALRLYAPLVQASNASPAVVAEAADCYERTGDTKQAAVLRTRAQPAKALKSNSAKPAASPKE